MRTAVGIVAVAFALAGCSHSGGPSIKLLPVNVYEAEQSYNIALTAADKYIDACIGDKAKGLKAALPASCLPIAQVIQDSVRSADAAYQVVMDLEANPPQNAIDALWSAAHVVCAVLPVNFVCNFAR